MMRGRGRCIFFFFFDVRVLHKLRRTLQTTSYKSDGGLWYGVYKKVSLLIFHLTLISDF